MAWQALAAEGVGALARIIGNQIAAAEATGNYEKAQELLAEYERRFGGISIPEDKITPEVIANSEVAGASADPASIEAQRKALAQLVALGQSQGLDPESQYALQEAQREAAQYERGQRQGILESGLSRGLGRGNMVLAAQLQAQQSGADRASQAATSAAAQARQRALQALVSGGQLAGQVRSQSFVEDERRREAADMLRRWNADRNVSAQQANAQLGLQRAGLRFQQLRDQAGLAGRRAGIQQEIGGVDAAKWASLGQDVGNIASAGGKYFDGGLGGASDDALLQELKKRGKR